MSQMLRHKPTGVLYIATPQLLKRTDMEIVDDTPLVIGDEAAKPAPKAPRKPAQKKPAIVGTSSVEDDSAQAGGGDTGVEQEPEEDKPSGSVDDLFKS